MADETASTATSADQTATDQTSTDAATTAATDQGTTADASNNDLTTALGGDDKAAVTGDATTGTKVEVPETYELTLPEGFDKLDDKAIEAATPVFKELGLSNDQANKLMPVVGEYAKRLIDQRDQQFLGTILEQRKEWLETAQKDPEIGGANWDASLRDSARALDQLGFPKGSPLRAALNESGFGNHPEMIRLMAHVGKAIGEDESFVRGDASTAKPKDPKEILYPGQSKREG